MTHHICYVTVLLEARPVFHLPFTADDRVGFGSHGEAVVTDENQRTLYKFEITEDESYTQMWHRELPQDIKSGCRKSMTASHNILLQDTENSPILILSPDGSQLLDTMQNEGKLIDSIPAGLVCRVWDDDRGYELVTVGDGGEVSRLQPEARNSWSVWTSVCQDELGRTAVINEENCSLDVFSGQQRKSYTLQHSYSIYC